VKRQNRCRSSTKKQRPRMAHKPPYFRFYVDDFAAELMSTEAVGAFDRPLAQPIGRASKMCISDTSRRAAVLEGTQGKSRDLKVQWLSREPMTCCCPGGQASPLISGLGTRRWAPQPAKRKRRRPPAAQKCPNRGGEIAVFFRAVGECNVCNFRTHLVTGEVVQLGKPEGQ